MTWIECGKKWDEMVSRQYGNTPEPALGAGVQLEIRDARSGALSRILIGDINTLGGVCDDCTGISREDLVVRYRILLTDEQMAGE